MVVSVCSWPRYLIMWGCLIFFISMTSPLSYKIKNILEVFLSPFHCQNSWWCQFFSKRIFNLCHCQLQGTPDWMTQHLETLPKPNSSFWTLFQRTPAYLSLEIENYLPLGMTVSHQKTRVISPSLRSHVRILTSSPLNDSSWPILSKRYFLVRCPPLLSLEGVCYFSNPS